MKKVLALISTVILAASLIVSATFYQREPFQEQAKAATGAIFIGQERRFDCSGTEIGKTDSGDGVFLTARHCVADPYTNVLNQHIVLSFSANQGGPFYDARPFAISLTDDLALLVVRDGANIPTVKIKDEHWLKNGDPIFNVSFPLSTGKQVFHGEFMQAAFLTLPEGIVKEYSMWDYSMPMNLTIAHGSSGSGVFSEKGRALIGVAVGTFEEGSYNIAIPADRVINLLNTLKENSVEKFKAAFPDQDAPPEGLF